MYFCAVHRAEGNIYTIECRAAAQSKMQYAAMLAIFEFMNATTLGIPKTMLKRGTIKKEYVYLGARTNITRNEDVYREKARKIKRMLKIIYNLQ